MTQLGQLPLSTPRWPGKGSEMKDPATSDFSWRFDLVAGLTAAAIVIPKAMAYATVAGLPVAVGLYTAFVPMVVYALLGSSRVLSFSSTATLAILAGAELQLIVPDGNPATMATAAATLSLLTGAVLVLAAVMRFGFVANFISSPVLTGFKAGIGLVIVLDQLPKLLGIHIAKRAFFPDLLAVVSQLPEISLATMSVAVLTLLLLAALKRYMPNWPAPLIAVGGAIAASWALDLSAHGVSIVGQIPKGLPPLTLPDLNLVARLMPGALGIALMSFTESIAAGRAFAQSSDPPINANRELIAGGAGNLAGALFGSMPAGGGTSQTAVVRAVGGQSQKASLVTAAASVATMMFLAPLLALLPNATLAAVVIFYSVGLISASEFVAIQRIRPMEFAWALVALLGVLVFGTLQGIIIAIVVSLISLAHQAATPHVYVLGRKRGTEVFRPWSDEHPDDETFDGLLLLRPEGRLFFVNAQLVADRISALIQNQNPSVVVLDLSRVPDIEYSVIQMLLERERLTRESGRTFWFTGLNPGVMTAFKRSGLAERLGRERMFFNVETAVEHYLATRKSGIEHM